MPSSLLCDDGRILTSVRTQFENKKGRIDLYESSDEGKTWNQLPPAVASMGPTRNNPPALIRLNSGRFCLIFGYRNEPYSIRARISDDQGRTWSEDILLRHDAGDWDIGYPRVVLRCDGRVVTGYYFDTHTDEERFIAVTIWDAEIER